MHPASGGVPAGVPDGAFHNLHPHQLPGLPGHGKADGPRPAVEVQQDIARGEGRQLRRLAVKQLCPLVVHLVEGEGGNLHLHPRQSVPDAGLPIEDLGFPAKDDIGALGVAVQEDGGDAGAGG